MKKKNRSAWRALAIAVCAVLITGGIFYIARWEQTRSRIEAENAMWSALYAAKAQPASSPSVSFSATAGISATARGEKDNSERADFTSTPALERTISPAPSPTARPSTAPSRTPAASATLEAAVDSTATPRATADSDTLVYAMETPPPAQESFGDLLALNPDTIGFLRIEDVLSLPVVQRANDNTFYLDHSFSLEESIGGTLFLDGSNLLVPEDDSLIIYGHNMRNGTMFRPLTSYEQLSFLKEHPLVHFDSIYENRSYAPFSVFTVTTDVGSERYLNLRQFQFDEESWADYISDMRALSIHDIPVDVLYGDHVLLLVTCEYTHNNGRFVVALRALREGESEDALRELVLNAH